MLVFGTINPNQPSEQFKWSSGSGVGRNGNLNQASTPAYDPQPKRPRKLQFAMQRHAWWIFYGRASALVALTTANRIQKEKKLNENKNKRSHLLDFQKAALGADVLLLELLDAIHDGGAAALGDTVVVGLTDAADTCYFWDNCYDVKIEQFPTHAMNWNQ